MRFQFAGLSWSRSGRPSWSYGKSSRRMKIGTSAAVVTMLCAVGLALAVTSSRAVERPINIVAFGDSLTAGYGLAANEAFSVQLQRALDAKGLAVNVVNAGVSGDTSAGGLS